MSRKIAVIFPGLGYSNEYPLLYYSRSLLEKSGYEVIGLDYSDILSEIRLGTSPLAEMLSNKNVRDSYLKYLAKINERIKKELEDRALSPEDRLVFVSKSIGSIISAVYAKQMDIKPLHLMLTPIDYTFQLLDDGNVSVFCGTDDKLSDFELVKNVCAKHSWNLYEFEGADHSLETGNVSKDIENLKRYLLIAEKLIGNFGNSVYDYEIVCRDKLIKSMSEYKGKVLVIVNTATGCGFTPQYKVLEQLYRKYNAQGLEILDFPCNQFDNQAPGTDSEIHSFCTSRYDTSFERFSKILVNGENQSELYKYLKEQKGFAGFDTTTPDGMFLKHKLEKIDPNYRTTSDIKWNFTKFLINRDGQVVERFEPTTDLNLLEEAIKKLL